MEAYYTSPPFCFSIPDQNHSSDSSRSLFLVFLIALKPLYLPIQSHASPDLATSHHPKYTITPRRVSTHGGPSSGAIRPRAPAGVRKKRRIRPAPSRYGQQQDPDESTCGTEPTHLTSSNTEEPEESTTQYCQSFTDNERIQIS